MNGKNDGRDRMFDAVDLEERLAELLDHPFQMTEMRALVDHQAFDLMEHRRVRLVGIAAIGAAGNDDADRRLLRSAWCAPAPATYGCAAEPRAVRLRREEERVVHLPRRMVGGKLSLVKL